MNRQRVVCPLATFLLLATMAMTPLAPAAQSPQINRPDRLGTWQGVSNPGFIETAVTIETIDETQAAIHLVTSESRGMRVAAKDLHLTATVDRGVLKARIPVGGSVSIASDLFIEFLADGTLSLKQLNSAGERTTILKKK